MPISKAAALLQGSCPRCRQGKMFASPAWNLVHFSKMNETCPHCGVRLEPEPGFYQGAMYVSYGFAVIGIVAMWLLLHWLWQATEVMSIVCIVTVLLLLTPLNYRYSRIVFLYLFGGIKFEADRS